MKVWTLGAGGARLPRHLLGHTISSAFSLIHDTLG